MLGHDQFQDLETVEAAALEPDVEEDEMRPARADRGQRLVGRTRRARPVPFVVEDARDEIADVRLVVDDEDIRAHALTRSRSDRG